MNSTRAIQEGYVDEEILPHDTRNILIEDLVAFQNKTSAERLEKNMVTWPYNFHGYQEGGL